MGITSAEAIDPSQQETKLPFQDGVIACLSPARAVSQPAQDDAFLLDVLEAMRTRRRFHELVEKACHFVPRPGLPAFNVSLCEVSGFKVSLMAVSPLKPIPLHDHPGSAGIQLVIAGCLCARIYQISDTLDPRASMVMLDMLAEHVVEAGGTCTYQKTQGNIHCLAAVSTNVVLICLQSPPSYTPGKSYYLPFNADFASCPDSIYRRLSWRREDGSQDAEKGRADE